MTVKTLKEVLDLLPENAQIQMYSDQEGNDIHNIWRIETYQKNKNLVTIVPEHDSLVVY